MDFTTRLKEAVIKLLTSGKLMTALLGLFAGTLARHNIILSPDQINEVIAVFSALLIGQGLTDHGKSKAQIEAANPPLPPIAAGGDVNIEKQ